MSVYLAAMPASWARKLFQIEALPQDYRLALLVIGACNLVVSLIFERLLVPFSNQHIRRLFYTRCLGREKRSAKLYKRIIQSTSTNNNNNNS